MNETHEIETYETGFRYWDDVARLRVRVVVVVVPENFERLRVRGGIANGGCFEQKSYKYKDF